jgi:ribonucleoside-triphosphate reductase
MNQSLSLSLSLSPSPAYVLLLPFLFFLPPLVQTKRHPLSVFLYVFLSRLKTRRYSSATKTFAMTSDLASLTFLSHYARAHSDGTLESYRDVIDRVFDMHHAHLGPAYSTLLSEARVLAHAKILFPSGRSLQFGGLPILQKHARMFNCVGAFAVAPEILYKLYWLLLCGCGVGLSVQTHHVAMLPPVAPPGNEKIIHVVQDSVEGWALAFRALLTSFFVGTPCQPDENLDLDESVYKGKQVVFQYDAVRPKGSKISCLLGRAPGPGPLQTALERTRALLMSLGTRKLRPIDVFDIVGHMADSVLAGGVRRSAMLMMFSADDEEMMRSKTGNWFTTAPQRARANISAIILRDKFDEVVASKFLTCAREFGEPGFILADETELIVNPCAEIALYPRAANGRYGFEACNLTEINVKLCTSEAVFLAACRASATLGTVQATYTTMPFLGKTTETIMNTSRLLGGSLTGVMENTAIGLNAELLRRGSLLFKKTNEEVASRLGIFPSHRLTTIKPAGTSSCVLGLSGCGVHPPHSRRYIRRVQCSDDDELAAFYASKRPLSIDKSVWGKSTNVLSFPITLAPDVRTKQDMGAIALMDAALILQRNWVLASHDPSRQPKPFRGNNNVSLTVTVTGDTEWKQIETHLVRHKHEFTGITFFPGTSDLTYDQAPFTRVLTSVELVETYGTAVLFATDIIATLKRSHPSLHAATRCASNSPECKADHLLLRRFAGRFFERDETRAKECLLDLDVLRTYETLIEESRRTGNVDWKEVRIGNRDRHEAAQAAKRQEPSCVGGACILVRI